MREAGVIPSPRHTEFFVSREEIATRIASLKTALKGAHIALAWIDHIVDLAYYAGSMQAGVLLVPANGDPAYFVRKSRARAEAESPLIVGAWPGRKGLLKEAAARLGSTDALGLSCDVATAAAYTWLNGNLAGHAIKDMSLILRLQKAVKSEWELVQIRHAAAQVNTLFAEAGKHVRAGITEVELSASVEQRLRHLGHGGIVRVRKPGSDMTMLYAISGDAARYPTNFDGPDGGEGCYPLTPAGAGRKRLALGETVMLDIVTSYNGYHADNARTYFLGSELPTEAAEAHDFCDRVLARLEAHLKPGTNCATLYNETLAWAEEQGLPEGFMGYEENRVRFFGHGIGLELDELPVIAGRIDLDLKPNMVIAIEPKAFLKGIGAVGLENTYVITEDGYECLCDADRAILRLT